MNGPFDKLRANGRKAYFRNNAKLTCLELKQAPSYKAGRGLFQFENPNFTLPIISESRNIVKLSPSRVAGLFEW